VRPRVDYCLVCNTSLLRHLEQSLFRHVALRLLFGQAVHRLAAELGPSLVLLNDCWRRDLRILWLLLDEEAFWQVVPLSLESGKIFNRLVLLKAVFAAGAERIDTEEFLGVFLGDDIEIAPIVRLMSMSISHGSVARKVAD